MPNSLHAVPFKTCVDTIYYIYSVDAAGSTHPITWIHGDLDTLSEYAFSNGFDSVIIEEKPYIRRDLQ